MGENIGRKFSPLNVSACFSTTTRAMNKWIAQSHSAHQIGPGPTPYRVLIVGWWCSARWFKFRSGKSFFNVCGSFTWLHYNQTNILENQALLLARNSFYTGHPGSLLVRLFKEFLARPVLWLSEKLWELLLCNLLTRDFAYLSILYGSRREMPTGLIDCIVRFFMFCCRWSASVLGERLHPGEASHPGEGMHLPVGEVMRRDTMSTMQYMVLVWQFKRWFLLTGSTFPSDSQVSKIPNPESRQRKLTSQLTIASVLLILPPFTFTRPPFSLPFSARTYITGINSISVESL
jgi:hypothetical protein